MGDVRRPDHGGSKCANWDVRLKFSVNVNVARDVKTPCSHQTLASPCDHRKTGGKRKKP
jgi:hypothetical protein